MSANISVMTEYSRDDFEYSSIYKDMKTLEDFDAESYYESLENDIENSKYKKFDIDNLGILMSDIYEKTCKEHNIKPLQKILNLRKKDTLQIYILWEKIFKQKYKYMKSKVNRLLDSKNLE
jgi:hypothetical protein